MADARRDFGVGVQRDGVDHQGVAFPMADGVAVEGRIRVGLMAAAVGVDAPHLAVGLDGDGHPARRIEEFERIGPGHDPRHAGRKAVGALVLQALLATRLEPGLVFGGQLRLGLGRRRLGAVARLPVDVPDALVEVRQPLDRIVRRAAIAGAGGARHTRRRAGEARRDQNQPHPHDPLPNRHFPACCHAIDGRPIGAPPCGLTSAAKLL